MTNKGRWFFGLVFFLIFLLAAELMTNYFVRADQHLDEILEFARSSAEVESQFGEVESLKVTKITRVAATPSEGSYRIYALHAEGSERSGIFEVILHETEDKEGSVRIRIGR